MEAGIPFLPTHPIHPLHPLPPYQTLSLKYLKGGKLSLSEERSGLLFPTSTEALNKILLTQEFLPGFLKRTSDESGKKPLPHKMIRRSLWHTIGAT